MSLGEYRRKRDPKVTPEPFAGKPKRGKAPIFVVQRHDARRLHYDFRLERNGALASWAVPKGVPLEPGARALAVHVEDHPLDYATFAGEIPKGQYGAGSVEIWDSGVYELLEEKANGQLKVRLDGKRPERDLVARARRARRQARELAPDQEPRRSGGAAAVEPDLQPDARDPPRRPAHGRRLALRGEVRRLPRACVHPRRRVPPRLAERERPHRTVRSRRKGDRQGDEEPERRPRRRDLPPRSRRTAELLRAPAGQRAARLLRLRSAGARRRAARRPRARRA